MSRAAQIRLQRCASELSVPYGAWGSVSVYDLVKAISKWELDNGTVCGEFIYEREAPRSWKELSLFGGVA